MAPQLMSIAGIAAILLMAFALSTGRKRIRLRVVGAAFALQALLALLIVRTPWGAATIQAMADGVSALLSYATTGTEFLFGATADNPLAGTFALGALPVIIFFAALVSILYYWGIMQQVVRWVGGAIGFVTGISKVESLGAAANIFVGQSESPLVVRPYLAALHDAEVVEDRDQRGEEDDHRQRAEREGIGERIGVARPEQELGAGGGIGQQRRDSVGHALDDRRAAAGAEHEPGDRDLQRERGSDHAQADALLARGQEEGDAEDRDDADEVYRDRRHALLSSGEG